MKTAVCPLCYTLCELSSSDEGTNSFVPIITGDGEKCICCGTDLDKLKESKEKNGFC
jgi:hypothetical protein